MKLFARTRSRVLHAGLICITSMLATTGMAQAADTGSMIFGNAGPGQHMTVIAVSTTGVVRSVPVNAKGSYVISHLPAGEYTVSLSRQGTIIDRKRHIKTSPGGGNEVDFGQSPSHANHSVRVTD